MGLSALASDTLSTKDLNRRIPVFDVDVQYRDGLLISKSKREEFKRISNRIISPVASYLHYIGSTRYSISLEAIGITTDAETYSNAFGALEQQFIGKDFGYYYYDPTLAYLSISEAKNLCPEDAIRAGLVRRAYYEFQNPLQRRMEKIRDGHKLQDILEAAKKLGATIAPHHKKFFAELKILPTDKKPIMIDVSLSDASKKYKYQIPQVSTSCRKSGYYTGYHPYGRPIKRTNDISNCVNNFLDRLEGVLN